MAHRPDDTRRKGAPAPGMTRRSFLEVGAAGLGAAMIGGAAGCARSGEGGTPLAASAQRARALGAAPESFLAAPPIETVRIGFVGVGGMGTNHVRNLARIPGARIQAVCDIRPEHAERAKGIIMDAGHPEPTLYTRGETDFVRMCEEEDLDLVYTATPWRWHVPVLVAAMKNGKHAATEVPAALTIDECWEMVETAEQTGKHCVMMENCNYDRPELMVLNMVRQGLFGEVLHGECGYLHDLRGEKFSDEGEGLWRREYAKTRDANLYPTHGLGPIANVMDINRGDRFAYLVSMSSPSRGLELYAREHFPEGDPKRQETFACGDVNSTLIKTARGRTIYLGFNTDNARPYSRINMVQGTKGVFHGYPNRIFIEGRTEGHAYEDPEAYFEEFDHPLWQTEAKQSAGIGHGGMDYLEDYRLIHCLRNGLPTDMNVYDAAALSVVTHLTELSIADGSAPIEFPDFTRGRWETWQWGESSSFGRRTA